jgi:hypothetical protein
VRCRVLAVLEGNARAHVKHGTAPRSLPGRCAPGLFQAATAARFAQASLEAAGKRLAMQAGVSIAILAALVYVLNLPGFAQALVTTIAVVTLPIESVGVDATRSVLEKMVPRVTGCLLAGVIAIALLPLLCVAALRPGVWVGCHLQTGKEGASYLGRQFTVAFIIVFVQDHR